MATPVDSSADLLNHALRYAECCGFSLFIVLRTYIYYDILVIRCNKFMPRIFHWTNGLIITNLSHYLISSSLHPGII